MKKRQVLILLAGVVLLAGWKPTVIRSASATPQEEALAKAFAPDPARALVYVYRESRLLGKSAESQLVMDKVSVAKNENGRFIVLAIAPGAHTLMSLAGNAENAGAQLVHNSRKTPVDLAAEAGRLYFFQESFKPLTGFTLTAVSPDAAQTAIVKSKLLARYEL